MARGKHLINVHTGTGTTEPSGASLYLGEIAVQHTPEEPALWIKVGTSEDSEVYEKFIGKTEITNIFNDTKILGSGYTYSGLPYVNSATTLADAYSALTNEVILDEKVTSAALNDLNDRVKEISAATGNNTEILEYIQENEEVVAGALNNLNDRVATVETHMTGDYIPLEGYVLASGLTEEELMITSADTVNEAFGKIQKQNLDNEEAIAASLNDLNGRLVDVAEEVARNTGVTVLSGVVTNLVGEVEGQGTALRALSSATRSLSSATQSLSGVVRTISGKTNGVLTLTMNGVEQGKYSPSASTTINLEAIQDVTGADVLLTGYELASGTTEEELAIVPTDTVNEAFGKIQKQNYDNEAVIAGAMNHFNEILLGFSGIIIDDEYVTAAALNDLDGRLDAVEESTTGVSGLSEGVQALSASVEDFEEIAAAAFNDLNDRIEALSASSIDPSIVQKVETLSSHVETNEFVTAAALNDLNARIIELSGNSVDTALTLDVQELSGTVIDLQAEIASSSGLAALSAAVVTISGQVSANTTNIEALSGKVLNNDLVIAAIFNDLNDRVIELSGDTNEEILDILAKIDEISGNTGGGGGGTDVAPLSAAVLSLSAAVVTISGNTGGGGSSDPNAITGITMNGNAVSVSNHVASLGTVLTDSSNFITALGTNENYLTYTKNGSANNITVPFATKSSHDEDGHLLKYYYIPYNAVVNPTNNFSSCQLFSSQINDAFYALDKRRTITFSGFQSSNAAQLFNNNYNNTGTVIAAGETGIITIGSESDAAFVTYPYGSISLSFYIESTKGKPSSISIRAYGTKSNTVGWYDYETFTNEKTPNGNSSNAIFTCNNNNIYNIKCWEITIVAHDTLPTVLSEIYAIFKRSNGEVDQSVVTKFSNKQTLYGEIVIDNNITSKSFIKSGGTSSQFLKADGSVDNNSYITGYTETDPTVPSWAKASTKPTYTASEVGALPTGTTLDNVADGATRKLSNYATTGTVNTLNNTVTAHTGNTNIHVTTAQTAAWNGKQDAINDLAEIRSNAASGMAAYNNVNALSAATTAMSVNVGKIAVTGVTVTGTGNAVTNAAYSNSALTLTKGNVLTAETLTGVSLAGTAVTLSSRVAPIPSASSSAFGVVKTGNFISNNNGTIAVATGTTNTTVAVGNHTHTASQVGALPTGTTLDGIADGTTRKLSNYATTGNVNTLSSATQSIQSSAQTAYNSRITGGTITSGSTNSITTTNNRVAITAATLLSYSTANNDQVLMIKNGVPQWVTPSTITYSSSAPTGGNDGDIWIQTS